METLLQIFPGMDKDIVGWVLEENEGDLGKSIEGLLEMTRLYSHRSDAVCTLDPDCPFTASTAMYD